MSNAITVNTPKPLEAFVWPVWNDLEWSDRRRDGKIASVVSHATLRTRAKADLAARRGRGSTTGPVLTAAVGSSVSMFHPMTKEHAALFRKFADLDPLDKSEIRAFASSYGFLGISVRGPIDADLLEDWSSPQESLLTWAAEIHNMRHATRLTETRSIRRGTADGHRADLINLRLNGVRARLIFADDTEPWVTYEPTNLRAALWLQLALAVASDKKFIQCKHCAELLEISTEATGHRSHREFCSESCKTLDYRSRVRQAKELAISGLNAASISKRLSTNPTTVERWLRKFNATAKLHSRN